MTSGRIFSGLFLFFLSFSLNSQTSPRIFSVDSLFDASRQDDLGLLSAKGTETITIFRPDTFKNSYNHGAVLFNFKNVLFAMWQSSKRNEDEPGTTIWYAKSEDGQNWSDPIQLLPPSNKAIYTSGGWWAFGDTLVAFINLWPDSIEDPKGGFTCYKTSFDGEIWTDLRHLRNKTGLPVKGIIEQDLRKIDNTRILTAFHMQPGLRINPYFTDDSTGLKDWTPGKMELLDVKNGISRCIEPSWFIKKDSSIVMIFRDQHSSFKKLASISQDKGENWTVPEIIDTPDSRAKQSAGNLPDGTVFMVNNPVSNKNRYPLVIILSKDGNHFDKAYLIRGKSDLPPTFRPGKYKRAGYSYPKSIVWGSYLYIAYATNKEIIELTRIPIESLIYF